jgi:hypothetical protein
MHIQKHNTGCTEDISIFLELTEEPGGGGGGGGAIIKEKSRERNLTPANRQKNPMQI